MHHVSARPPTRARAPPHRVGGTSILLGDPAAGWGRRPRDRRFALATVEQRADQHLPAGRSPPLRFRWRSGEHTVRTRFNGADCSHSPQIFDAYRKARFAIDSLPPGLQDVGPAVAHTLADLVVSSYIRDMRSLVSATAEARLAQLPRRPAAAFQIWQRLNESYEAWIRSKSPFQGQARIPAMLVSSGPFPGDLYATPIAVDVHVTYPELSFELTNVLLQRPGKPFLYTPKGELHVVTRILGNLARPLVSEDRAKLQAAVSESIHRALFEQHVHLVPWHGDARSPVDPGIFVELRAGITRARPDGRALTVVERQAREAAEQAQSMRYRDPTQPWRLTTNAKVPFSLELHTPYLVRRRLPTDVFHGKNQSVKNPHPFIKELAGAFDGAHVPHFVGFQVGLILCAILPHILVTDLATAASQSGGLDSFRNQQALEELWRSDAVAWRAPSNPTGVKQPVGWLESWLLAWVYYLRVRDGEHQIVTRPEPGTAESVLYKRFSTWSFEFDAVCQSDLSFRQQENQPCSAVSTYRACDRDHEPRSRLWLDLRRPLEAQVRRRADSVQRKYRHALEPKFDRGCRSGGWIGWCRSLEECSWISIARARAVISVLICNLCVTSSIRATDRRAVSQRRQTTASATAGLPVAGKSAPFISLAEFSVHVTS